MQTRSDTAPYHGDAPIRDQAEDAFDRWPFAQRIAESISSRVDPSNLCVGIYGSWGEGKTTAMAFIESQLRSADVCVVHFNPWRFESERDLFVGFFTSLAAGIGGSLDGGKKRKIAKAIAPYAKFLRPLSFGLFGVSVSTAELTTAIEEAAVGGLEVLKGELETLIEETGKRLVVFIDDIDRLDRHQVHTVFKLIKSCADFRHTTYVLAFDDSVVAASLGREYGEGDKAAGYGFLEKIVQVPLRLPSASETALRNYCLLQVQEVLRITGIRLSEDERSAFVTGFDRAISKAVVTPRMAKRYSNALTFAIPILRGEVNPVDLLLIEGVRVFFPPLYEFIRSSPKILTTDSRETGDRKLVAESVGSALQQIPEDFRNGARGLLTYLFPRLRAAFENFQYGDDYDKIWVDSQRICAPSYFQRYFTYAVPRGDVPDGDVTSLLNAAMANDIEAVQRQLEILMARGAPSSIANKLWQKLDSFSPTAAGMLAVALAPLGRSFPQTETVFSFSPFVRMGALIASLIAKVPNRSDRRATARATIQRADPLGFAKEILRFLRSSDDTNEADRTFSKEEEQKLGKELANRIRSMASPALIRAERDIHELLSIWSRHRSQAETKAFMRKSLKRDATLAIPYLKSILAFSYPLDGPPRITDFEGEHYGKLNGVVEHNDLHRALVKEFGAVLDEDDFYISRKLPVDQRIACQFAIVHRRSVGAETR